MDTLRVLLPDKSKEKFRKMIEFHLSWPIKKREQTENSKVTRCQQLH